MKILKVNFIVYFFIAASLQCIAQEDVKSLLKQGDKLFKREHYRNALPYFEKVLQIEPNNEDALFSSAVCYLNRHSKDPALKNIEKAYAQDSTFNKHIHYWMGRVYHQNYQFEKALYHYNAYKSTLKKRDQRVKDLDLHIYQVRNAMEFVANPQNFYVKNLGPNINSTYAEHSPVTSADDNILIFTSRRHIQPEDKEDLDGEPFEDIFMSRRQSDGEWGKPESIHLNTSGHDASIQLFDNDKKLLIYKFTKGGDIYMAEKKGEKWDQWNDPEKFANINTRDFEADAFITPDGNTLYYATNHFKKNGDLDIYFVTKDANGNWSKPQELKGGINTDEDEDAPYISDDGKVMYFSSRGHNSMGGYDVFKSVRDDNGNWSKPENLGHPINTPDDDVYYYLAHNGKKGYLASYREGGLGEKDIYEILNIAPVIVKGVVSEDKTGKKIDNVTVSLVSQKNTTAANSATASTNKDGIFETQVTSYNKYKITVTRDGATVLEEELDIPFQEETITLTKNIVIPFKEEVVAVVEPKKEEVKETAKETPVAVFVPRNVYFGTAQWELSRQAKAELDKLVKFLKDSPGVKVSVEGHTDSQGAEDANQKLSEKRAKAAVDYLISKGISADRITSAGYGELRPTETNDTPKGRELNRRDEFKLVK